MTDERTTYSIEVNCNNCLTTQRVFIPKGTTKETYLKKKQCINCGCCCLDKDTTSKYY